MSSDRITCQQVRNWPKGQSLLAMTAYDVVWARLLDEGGVDLLHVGDTLAITMLGYPDTTYATMEDMVRHTGAVVRGRRRALVTADLPYRSYESAVQAVENARRLIDVGADAVKLEGGRTIRAQLEAVRGAGIEIQGHVGLLPQLIREERIYRKKGKTPEDAESIWQDALLLEELGAFSIVIENVVPAVAESIASRLKVPTLGIAAGTGTRGQIVVSPEIFGMKDWGVPPFVHPVEELGRRVRDGVARLRGE